MMLHIEKSRSRTIVASRLAVLTALFSAVTLASLQAAPP
jgi:hypothetical protein